MYQSEREREYQEQIAKDAARNMNMEPAQPESTKLTDIQISKLGKLIDFRNEGEEALRRLNESGPLLGLIVEAQKGSEPQTIGFNNIDNPVMGNTASDLRTSAIVTLTRHLEVISDEIRAIVR